MATSLAPVIDVTEQTFAAEVIERSKTVPVVVDFWAEWCGPCRMLGPILERLAVEYDGAFVLAKLDVDSNPGIARQYQIQGIPAVKAFMNGRVASEFTGALPEPQVRRFLDGLVPSNADIYARQGEQLEAQENYPAAIARYQAALTEQADHYSAMLGLGRALLKDDQIAEGVAMLEKIPVGVAEHQAAEALLASRQFQELAAGQSEGDLRAKLEQDPADVPTRYALASLLAAEGRQQEAMDEFLNVIYRDRQYEDDGARKAILALLNGLGDNHPLNRTYRQKLANALF